MHLTTSHGTDFNNEETISSFALLQLAPYAEAVCPASTWPTLRPYLTEPRAGLIEAGTAEQLATVLLRASTEIKARTLATDARRLADAAARAATDGMPWIWTTYEAGR
jgi:hypothetical protein